VLADGTLIPGDLLVVSTGVRPRVELAAAAGLRTDHGVLVDDTLTTSDPRIRAIGDCARHPGAESGLVQPAWEQAAVLADLLTDADATTRYLGTSTVTRLKAAGIELATMGDAHTIDDGTPDEHADDPTEVLRFDDPRRGRYAKLALRDDRVTGAIMIGLPDAAATVTQLYDSGAPAPTDRLALLLGRALPADTAAGARTPASLPDDAVLCRCNTVTKGGLVAAWHAGATSTPELARATRATTGCGGCVGAVTALASWLGQRDDWDADEAKTDSEEEVA
jgi:assimilatory nitrate reductase electron transfer subunit